MFCLLHFSTPLFILPIILPFILPFILPSLRSSTRPSVYSSILFLICSSLHPSTRSWVLGLLLGLFFGLLVHFTLPPTLSTKQCSPKSPLTQLYQTKIYPSAAISEVNLQAHTLCGSAANTSGCKIKATPISSTHARQLGNEQMASISVFIGTSQSRSKKGLETRFCERRDQ